MRTKREKKKEIYRAVDAVGHNEFRLSVGWKEDGTFMVLNLHSLIDQLSQVPVFQLTEVLQSAGRIRQRAVDLAANLHEATLGQDIPRIDA